MNNPEYESAVFWIAENRAQAMKFTDSLRSSGFLDSEISLVMAHRDGDGDIEIEVI